MQEIVKNLRNYEEFAVQNAVQNPTGLDNWNTMNELFTQQNERESFHSVSACGSNSFMILKYQTRQAKFGTGRRSETRKCREFTHQLLDLSGIRRRGILFIVLEELKFSILYDGSSDNSELGTTFRKVHFKTEVCGNSLCLTVTK